MKKLHKVLLIFFIIINMYAIVCNIYASDIFNKGREFIDIGLNSETSNWMGTNR